MASPEAESLADSLRDAYETAWLELTTEAEDIALDPRKGRRRARLRELLAAVEDRMPELDEQARQWFSEEYPVIYRLGASDVAAQLGQAFRWTTADQAAVNALAQEAFGDLLAATDGVEESTKSFVRRAARERALVGTIEGETAQQSARRLAQEMRRYGLRAVTYADGSNHGLGDYADVVLRTATGRAYNAGVVNLSRRTGVRFMECFDGADCGLSTHEDLDKPNGKVYPIEVAASYALSHPRCRRAWSPRPLVMTAEQARRAEPTTTVAQRDDQEAAERAQEHVVRQRAARRARQRRAARARA